MVYGRQQGGSPARTTICRSHAVQALRRRTASVVSPLLSLLLQMRELASAVRLALWFVTRGIIGTGAYDFHKLLEHNTLSVDV